jgi:hypothetical protein
MTKIYLNVDERVLEILNYYLDHLKKNESQNYKDPFDQWISMKILFEQTMKYGYIETALELLTIIHHREIVRKFKC